MLAQGGFLSALSLRYPPIQPANQPFVFLLLRVLQLDQICISFDNGKTTMNFTEAALLIQGSACIYSRKVRGGPSPVTLRVPPSLSWVLSPSSTGAALGF